MTYLTDHLVAVMAAAALAASTIVAPPALAASGAGATCNEFLHTSLQGGLPSGSTATSASMCL
jgi:hypothetical protein